jgi:transposase
MRTPGTAQELESRRMLAAGLLRRRRGVSEVARLVGRSKAAVSQWKKKLQTGGLDALKSKPHPGPKPRLSEQQKLHLVRLLNRGARQAGYGDDLWTYPRVARLIARQFQVEYHPVHVRKILRSLGWTWQKPTDLWGVLMPVTEAAVKRA